MIEEFRKEFIHQSSARIEKYSPRIVKCLNMLDDNDIWKRPNEASNSVGNIILHLCGNIRQYIISSLGGAPDIRERDKEFSTTGGLSKKELIGQLTSTVEEALKIIRAVDSEALLRIRSVQGNDVSGIGIVIQVTEHFAYHTGQIAFWTKLLLNKDLAFYANVNLNVKNKN